MASGWPPGIAIFKRGKRFHQLPYLNIFTTQWHCPDDHPYFINGRMVPRNCYFRKGQAVPSTSLPQHFRDPMALPWQLSVLHKWHQDGPPALLFSKGAEARVAFSISTFLRPNGIALTTSALVSDPSPTTNLRDRPKPPISNANTTAPSTLRDARQFFTTESTKGCISRYDEGIACFQGWLSVVIKMLRKF